MPPRYLTEQRGLSRLLIEQLVIDRYLFQEAKTNNAVFPIYENHLNVGADSKRGCGYNLTFGDEEHHRPYHSAISGCAALSVRG
ncbi:MAG: DUF3991 domain-containing protein [Oscillospiraceae bacterium]|nr:DUF3991 domain-containing protein [Oscillospiraceae bacterium]